MEYARKADTNQREMVEFLRRCGASVESLHRVGRGVPDLLVGYHGYNFIVEVKNKDTGGKLSQEQHKFHLTWHGNTIVAHTGEEALRQIQEYIHGKEHAE